MYKASKAFLYILLLALFTSITSITNASTTKLNKSNQFLIIANGAFNEKLIKDNIHNRTVIVLDGAFNKFHSAGMVAKYVLGDFDSIREEQDVDINIKKVFEYFDKIEKPQNEKLVFEEYQFNNTFFIRAASQNHTDLDKGIKFAIEKGGKDIKILGALGGVRTDHLLHNLSVLKKFKHDGTYIHIETEKEIIQFLKNEEIEFNGTPGAKLGLFGFPEARAASRGLVWELNKDYVLRLGFQDSSCNELKNSLVKISVEGEAILIRPNF